MPFTTLVTPADLARHLDNPAWIIFDCRHDLMDTEDGRCAYEASRIPGALFLHLDEDLSGTKNGKNGRHPLPSPEVFAARMSERGVDAAKQVIAYDASGGIYAARLWWMLRWLGHDAVAVLDGGLDAWRKAGHPMTSVVPQAKPSRFVATPHNHHVDADHVAAHLNHEAMCLLDARNAERFRGIGEVLDPVGGHIPGAINRFFKDNLDKTGVFKPAQELRQVYAQLIGDVTPQQVVHQCGSGVTACHNLLAMEIAGLAGSRLYPGSWSEWCSDPARPVER